MRLLARSVLVIFALLLAPASVPAQSQRPDQTTLAQHGVVVAQEARAAAIGRDVLERGGNAVDAAVAVGFALAVTHPQAGNLGGGGFMVVHLADRQDDVTIDYRETAPRSVTAATFLDAKGEADPEKSRNSALGIGVPRTVAGLSPAPTRHGPRPLHPPH